MKKIVSLIVYIACSNLYSQELFLRNEPASNPPKGVLGVRLFGETYNELGSQKNMFATRIMYGVLSKLTIMANVAISNHHNKILPRDLINHVHDGSNTSYFIKDQRRGLSYDYGKPSMSLFAKYRFLTKDAEHKHFRMAVYSEYSFAQTAHDEAEANLMDDNKGFGAGLLTTYLKNKFAISLTSGFILPQAYKESVTEEFDVNNNFKDDFKLNTKIIYGKALVYNLSIGYLLFPRVYKDYKQTNINLYAEFIGKAYQSAQVIQNNVKLPINAVGLKAGNYVELHPGVQFIFKSNLRIDLSVGYNLINRSYARQYPITMIGIQRYFYL